MTGKNSQRNGKKQPQKIKLKKSFLPRPMKNHKVRPCTCW
ncbi:hypothetical protein HMPREF1349_00776 [Enterococcus faecium 506]|nr:hypothetical protein HMPREF1349_00776 [Enterococcus faecium 506]